MSHQALCFISKPSVNSNWSYKWEMLNSGLNGQFFVPRDLEIRHMTLKNNRSPLLCYFKLLSHHLPAIIQLQPGNSKFWSKSALCDLKLWRLTLENNRSPHVTYFKLCASFHSHRSIQNIVTVRKRQIRVRIGIFWPRVTLKFDRRLWKTIGLPIKSNSSLVHHSIAIGQTVVIVQKRQSRVEIGRQIFAPVTLKFDIWLWKIIWHLFWAISSSVHDFITICECKLELQSGNGYVEFWPLWLWHLTSDLDLLYGHHLYPWQ